MTALRHAERTSDLTQFNREQRAKSVARRTGGVICMYACMSVADTLVRCIGVPRNFVEGGGSTNSVEDRGQRERGSGCGSPLVRGSGRSSNLVQEISFLIITFS